MKKTLITAAAAGAIILGSLGIAGPASAAPATSWDCDTSGRTQCTNRNLEDAWDSFDGLSKAPKYDHKHVLRYSGTFHKRPATSKKSVVIRSTSKKSTWHVFTYTK
jgi:hypothetical protein